MCGSCVIQGVEDGKESKRKQIIVDVVNAEYHSLKRPAHTKRTKKERKRTPLSYRTGGLVFAGVVRARNGVILGLEIEQRAVSALHRPCDVPLQQRFGD